MGRFSGWRKARLGQKQPQEQPIFDIRARKAAIRRVIAALFDGSTSLFQNEGNCRATLRSAMCLAGHGWQQSDREAAEIVRVALRAIGARRPTFAEGQREFTHPYDQCIYCGGPIDPIDLVHGYRYCSVACAKALMERPVDDAAARNLWLHYRAYYEVRKWTAPERKCAQCGGGFRNEKADAKYCSHYCVAASITIRPIIKCVWCDNHFRQQADSHVSCSLRCAGLFKADQFRKNAPEQTCPICETVFRPSMGGQVYCSKACTRSPPVRAAEYNARVASKRPPMQPVNCGYCKTEFTPPLGRQQMKYCSEVCRDRVELDRVKALRVPKSQISSCAVCSAEFEKQGRRQIYCGEACSREGRRKRRQTGAVIYLTVEIFDSWFKRAA